MTLISCGRTWVAGLGDGGKPRRDSQRRELRSSAAVGRRGVPLHNHQFHSHPGASHYLKYKILTHPELRPFEVALLLGAPGRDDDYGNHQ